MIPTPAQIAAQAEAPKPKVFIDDYVIDASLRENHRFESEATKYATESGFRAADSVVKSPTSVTIEGIVSDHPLPGPIATARGDSGDGLNLASKPSADAALFLQTVMDAGEPVTISTVLQTYDNMLMVSLEIPIDAETGAALAFTAEFEHIRFFTNNRTTIKVAPPKQTGLGAKKDLGNKPTFDLKKGAVIWHHHKFTPGGKDAWFDELVGYNKQDVITKGTSGMYHQDGKPFTQEDLDDFNVDTALWYRTHDDHGFELRSTDDANARDSQVEHSDALDRQSQNGSIKWDPVDQTWVNEDGQPATWNPVFSRFE